MVLGCDDDVSLQPLEQRPCSLLTTRGRPFEVPCCDPHISMMSAPKGRSRSGTKHRPTLSLGGTHAAPAGSGRPGHPTRVRLPIPNRTGTTTNNSGSRSRRDRTTDVPHETAVRGSASRRCSGALLLADQASVKSATLRTHVTAVPAVAVNRSGRPPLRLPTRGPWQFEFNNTLAALRALPGPAG